MQKRKSNKIIYFVSLIFVLILCIFSVVSGNGGGLVSYAATDTISEVLQDLKVDNDYVYTNYPQIKQDYSWNVMQIAESSTGELFVYGYHPNGVLGWAYNSKLIANSINISTELGDDLHFKNYPLEYVDYYSTLAKFKVKGFKVSDKDERTYAISSIMRPFADGIDNPVTNGNTVNLLAFNVSQLWTVSGKGDNVTYEMTGTKSVTVTSKFVGRVRYKDGFSLSDVACDSWFVAFSTDYDIDKLFDADIEYISRPYTIHFHMTGLTTWEQTGVSFGNYSEPKAVTLSSLEQVSNNGSWLGGEKRTWHRIESTEEFMQKETLKDEMKSKISSTQWVLRFAETGVSCGFGVPYMDGYYTEVSEVTILRLHFEANGQVLNLGVIDNKQTGTEVVNPLPTFGGVTLEWWQILLIVIAVLLALVILFAVLSVFFPIIGVVLKAVFGVLALPFKGLAALCQKIFKRE